MAGKITRADRRRREAKTRALWRRRFSRTKPWGPETPEQHAEWAERMVRLRAHHNKCPCGLCSLQFPGPKHPGVRRKRWSEDGD